MQTISEVFNTDNYIPFVLFCQGQRLTKMADLQYLSFEKLSQVPGLTPALIMRIKSVYTLYRKNHPEEFIGVKPKAAVSTAVANQEIIDQVERFFQQNATRVIHVNEIVKAVRMKKADVLQILAAVPWCKAVDTTSFFYQP